MNTHSTIVTALLSLPLLASSASAASAHTHAPYAGQQARAIKSLSAAELTALTSGAGAGFAKAAELNGYPGPTHVLELARPLRLQEQQRAATTRLMAEHKARARQLGAELVEAEAELDRLFATRQADAQRVETATQRVGALQASLRAEHLNTHLAQTRLLSDEQVRRYAVLRGYTPVAAGAKGHSHDHGVHDAIGVPGEKGKVSRTIQVDMNDRMRFVPAGVTVKQGETIRFVVKNSGQLKHEFVLGTDKYLKEHYEEMKKFPEMEHDDPNMVSLAPGKTGDVIWRFTKAGRVDFACLQPGHYEAGMKGAVKVAAVRGAVVPVALAQATQSGAAPPESGEIADGEVRKIDKEAKKITLRHGPIKSLDMPSMTMVFQVRDPALLDAVKAGDKVRFRAERSGGAMVVTSIESAR
jgi:uncharacterized cupredoxin-like copper-binding protein/Cu/Ag efflux protein CusF